MGQRGRVVVVARATGGRAPIRGAKGWGAAEALTPTMPPNAGAAHYIQDQTRMHVLWSTPNRKIVNASPLTRDHSSSLTLASRELSKKGAPKSDLAHFQRLLRPHSIKCLVTAPCQAVSGSRNLHHGAQCGSQHLPLSLFAWNDTYFAPLPLWPPPLPPCVRMYIAEWEMAPDVADVPEIAQELAEYGCP